MKVSSYTNNFDGQEELFEMADDLTVTWACRVKARYMLKAMSDLTNRAQRFSEDVSEQVYYMERNAERIIKSVRYN